ncbi:MAG: hypothetical protein WCJ94_01525 [bacterium]
MDQLFLFIIVTGVFLVAFRDKIFKTAMRPDKTSIIVMIVLLLVTVGGILLKIIAVDSRWFIIVAWQVAVITIYSNDLVKTPLLMPYFFAFMLSMFSFLILPYNIFTPYIFLASGFVFVLFTAEMYNDITRKFGLTNAYLFVLASAFTIKLFMLDYLQAWIAVPVAALVALFLCVRNAKGSQHYADEKNGFKIVFVIYIILILQCFVAVLIKNPLFN